MSVLERAAAEANRIDDDYAALCRQRLAVDQRDVGEAVRYRLELPKGAPLDLVCLNPERGDYGAHWTFTVDGVSFEACKVWHGSSEGHALHLWRLRGAREPEMIEYIADLARGGRAGARCPRCDRTALSWSKPRKPSWLARLLALR